MKNEQERLKKVFEKRILGGMSPGSPKAELRNAARGYYKKLGAELGVEGEIRFNPGGSAVCGDAVFHADKFYINISQSGLGLPEIMFRTCEGHKDYSGGQNNWLPIRKIEDLPRAIRKLVNI